MSTLTAERISKTSSPKLPAPSLCFNSTLLFKRNGLLRKALNPLSTLSKLRKSHDDPALIQHQSASSNWYTPIPILEMARTVLGGIDLDPASDAFGNSRVRASVYYTEASHDSVHAWSGRIFLNPPGGKVGNESRMKIFWERLVVAKKAGFLEHAIFLAFSLEALQSTQTDCGMSLCDFPLCIPAQRIRFDRADGKRGPSPSHANAICYVPGTTDQRNLFAKVFAPLGACINVYLDWNWRK